ncbi:MAG TPA: SusC/RagA family TonB-linked outer membrane protein [Longimicrobiaceae bacterium]|nr:SusC/RagA family TonB-linked outer membrane protein [Longimicrobiaceae bacterium]
MVKKTFVLALLLLAVPLAGFAQEQRQVTGQVVSAAGGAPLGDARVVIAGTSRGTTTDPQGNFTLSVPAGAVRLRVSQVGYVAQDVAVPPGQGQVTVRLAQDVLNLEGIVVTGQATAVARRNLPNAVAVVTADQLTEAPAQTVEKALQGKIAGANIQTNSGAPGGGVQVSLRGVSSINAASEPLWVIDGVVVSNVAIPSGANAVTRASSGSNASAQDAPVNRIADINPEDIETIEVLKGASASAIYGSQASNGVIIVTTKRGRSGAPQVSVTQRVGQYSLSNTLGMRNWTRDEAVGAFGASAANFFDASGRPLQQFNLEEMIAGRRDLSTETALSIRGGDDNGSYFVSGLWLDDAGIIDNTGYEKQSLRLNLDQRLGSRVRVGFNGNVIHSVAERGLTNNDNSGTSFYMVLPFTPNFVDLRRDNNTNAFPDNPFERSNPLQTIALMTNEEEVWRSIASGNAEVGLIDTGRQQLRLLANAGADYFQQENRLFFPPELEFEDDDQQPGTSLLNPSSNLNLTANTALVHTYSPGDNLTATTSAGVQYLDQDLNILQNIGRNLVAGQRNVDAATSIEVFQTRRRTRTLGLYLQEELLLMDERLLLTGSVRADQSSANGDTEKFFLYPKASASYRLPGIGRGVDELKLRLAYGESGNQPLFGQKFTPLSAANNIGGLPGLVLPLGAAVAGDPDITPERMREIEGGVDVVLFGGNANLEVTAYQQSITDLLLQRTVAPSSGFTTQFFNGGELRTRGVEIALGATPLRRDNFSWFTRTTFSANRSRIEELPVPSFRTGGFGTALGAFQIEEGESATQIVANVIRDGKVVVEKVGDANPDFQMAFTNELTFGRFQLYGLVDWHRGHEIINLTKLLFDFGQNTADFALDPQPGVDPLTGQPIRDKAGNQITTTRGSRRLIGFGRETRPYIEDGSFVKVREVSLSYEIPSRALSRVGLGVNDAKISLSGRNLLTFTDYTGLDPEVSNFGNQQIARNIDVAPFPPSRSIWLSMSLGF